MSGIDVSSYQNTSVIPGNEFVIIKASEGKNYRDEMLNKHYGAVLSNGIKNYGFYHYARPDLGNTPKQEVESFLKYTGNQHFGKCVYALDWEGKSIDYPAQWALDFLNLVYDKTGVKPLFYTYEAEENTGKYEEIAKAGFPLWIACWDTFGKLPTLRSWEDWAIWQYTSTPIDKDKLNANIKWSQLIKSSYFPDKKQEIINKLHDIIKDVKGL